MSNRTRFALIGAGLLSISIAAGVSAWLLAGGGGPAAQPAGAQQRRWTIQDAKQFKDFSLFWLGESFQGLPLTRVSRIDYPGDPDNPYSYPLNEVGFSYGDCTIPVGESSCGIPLSIDIVPYCDVPPEVIAESVKLGPPVEIRGAMVQWTGGTTSMRLWTSNVSIGINSHNEGLALAAAQNLVRINGVDPASPTQDLGAPEILTCAPLPGVVP